MVELRSGRGLRQHAGDGGGCHGGAVQEEVLDGPLSLVGAQRVAQFVSHLVDHDEALFCLTMLLLTPIEVASDLHLENLGRQPLDERCVVCVARWV